MKWLTDRSSARQVARALESGEPAGLDPHVAREVAAHRAVEDLLRRQSHAAGRPAPAELRTRVLAQLEPRGRTSPAARRMRTVRRLVATAAASVLLGVSTWFALRAQVEDSSPVAVRSTELAPTASGAPSSGLAAQLSALGALPRSSTSTLRSTIDQPLLSEVEKLRREARSFGRFLQLWAPPLALRDGDVGR